MLILYWQKIGNFDFIVNHNVLNMLMLNHFFSYKFLSIIKSAFQVNFIQLWRILTLVFVILISCFSTIFQKVHFEFEIFDLLLSLKIVISWGLMKVRFSLIYWLVKFLFVHHAVGFRSNYFYILLLLDRLIWIKVFVITKLWYVRICKVIDLVESIKFWSHIFGILIYFWVSELL